MRYSEGKASSFTGKKKKKVLCYDKGNILVFSVPLKSIILDLKPTEKQFSHKQPSPVSANSCSLPSYAHLASAGFSTVFICEVLVSQPRFS